MKFGTTLVLCAASALGTAFVLDKVTNGMVRDSLFNRDDDDLDDDFDDFDDNEKDDARLYEVNIEPEDEGIYALTRANTDENAKHDHVFMPIQDALNLYDMIKEAICKIDPDEHSDKCFGDKAISFERLYDAIEDDITSRDTAEDTECVNNDPIEHTEDNPSKLDPNSDNYIITDAGTF